MHIQRNHLDEGCSLLNSGQGQSHLLTDREVSTMLGVSVATVRRWRLFRTGPPYIKIGSSVRYRPDEVTRWLAACPVGGEVLAELVK
jgi:predicted DNA-binding transcriptional regulator AlpA